MSNSSKHPADTFLYQQWLCRTVDNYLGATKPVAWRGKDIRLSPRQFGAALLQAYVGGVSLVWLAQAADLPLQTLKDWRREPGFLWVMDWAKSGFAEDFCDHLTLTDYSMEQYYDIAGEFALLEDSLKVRVRVRLYGRLKSQGERLLSLHRAFLRMADSDLRLFRRLFLFFLILEEFWPSPAQARLRQKFLPLAREVVWPLLGTEAWLETELAQAREKWRAKGDLRDRLAPLIRERFACLF